MKKRTLWVCLFIILLIVGFGASYLLGAHNQYRDIAGIWEVHQNDELGAYLEAVNHESKLGKEATLTIKGDGTAVYQANTFDLKTVKINYELPRERTKNADSYGMIVKQSQITQSIYFDQVNHKCLTLYTEKASSKDASEEIHSLIDELKSDTTHQADIRDEAQENIYAQNYFDIVSVNDSLFKLTFRFPKKETTYLKVISKDKLESIDLKTNKVLATFTRKK